MSQINTFLDGVRILDLSQYIPGPLASLMLADMGAEVIKIEPPVGDPMQHLGPRDPNGNALFYETLNAGKSALRLDLKSEAGVAKLLELVATSDVLIEGFRPGVMDRLGISSARLREVNQRLIYCAISGYGAEGVGAQIAGHDANYLAESGTLDRNGTDRPMYFDPPVADVSGSLFAAMAILGALNGRHQSGRGCVIDLALADVIMPMQLLQVADYGANATVPERRGTYLNGGAAYYNIYETKDHRFVVVGAVEPKFWATFAHAAGQPEWIARQGEPIPQTELIADVAARIGALTVAECEARFGDSDCCFSAVLPIDQALSGQRIKERGLIAAAPGNQLQALFPALVDGRPPRTRPPFKEYQGDD